MFISFSVPKQRTQRRTAYHVAQPRRLKLFKKASHLNLLKAFLQPLTNHAVKLALDSLQNLRVFAKNLEHPPVGRSDHLGRPSQSFSPSRQRRSQVRGAEKDDSLGTLQDCLKMLLGAHQGCDEGLSHVALISSERSDLGGFRSLKPTSLTTSPPILWATKITGRLLSSLYDAREERKFLA